MPLSLRLFARLCTGLVPFSLGQPFTFNAPKHACGVCREVLSGVPCERFDACHVVNASAARLGCTHFCGLDVTSVLQAPVRQQTWLPDVRVVRGFGTKGYDQIRISVVSDDAKPPVDGFFDYSARFQYRWTENFLHSAMKSAMPGKVANFPLGPGVSVRLPRQGDGTAGVLIADPCVDSASGSLISWVGCTHGKQFKTYERTVALLNAFVPDDSTDYWGILGDNFYDRTGEISHNVFDRLSLRTKSKFFITVPGNHDYWIMGTPMVSTGFDQCANGFMQFYAQDAKAAEAVTAGSLLAPFNFSVDPSGGLLFGCRLPDISNMFWYNQIGNVGFVGQSGAHAFDEALPFMVEACEWLARQPGLQVAVLVGHWDIQELGVAEDMGMPLWYRNMAALPGCSDFHQRGMLKYVMGHTHSNSPHPRGDEGAGFRVAGFGMEASDANYGVPVLDTTDSRVRFWYFDTSSDDLYNSVISCVVQKGWRQCLDLATLWLDQPMPQASLEQVLV